MAKTTIFLLSGLIFMIFHADLVTQGAASGLLLWYSAVVPSLFPFMVLSSVLSSSDDCLGLLRPFAPLFHLFGLSPDGCYVFLTGLLCGCPMGAKTCADFLSEGRIRPGEARFLLALCNHPSPMFLSGFLYPMFASEVPLRFFVLAVYLPVGILAFFAYVGYLWKDWEIFKYSDRTTDLFLSSSRSRPELDSSGSSSESHTRSDTSCNFSASHPGIQPLTLEDSILHSSEVLVKIGGFLVFYSILILAVQRITVLPPGLRLFLSSVLEITTGLRLIHETLPFPYSAIAAVALFSFGGCSAVSQTNAVIRDVQGRTSLRNKKTAGLSIRQYLLWKFTHALLTAAIMAALTGVIRVPLKRSDSLLPALRSLLSR